MYDKKKWERRHYQFLKQMVNSAKERMEKALELAKRTENLKVRSKILELYFRAWRQMREDLEEIRKYEKKS